MKKEVVDPLGYFLIGLMVGIIAVATGFRIITTVKAVYVPTSNSLQTVILKNSWSVESNITTVVRIEDSDLVYYKNGTSEINRDGNRTFILTRIKMEDLIIKDR